MPDLRETLARRFHHAWWQRTPTPEGEELFQIPPGFYGLADECIRQMEWARRDLAVALDRDMAIVGPSLVEIPLTAAPDDWEVPK